MSMSRVLLPFLLLLFSSAAPADVEYLASEHHSAWVARSSPLNCRLEHEVPRYGAASFSHENGGQLQFRIDTNFRVPRTTEIRVSTLPPAWRHEVLPRELGYVIYGEESGFRAGPPLSLSLYGELEKGMQPAFTYHDLAGEYVLVGLSPVNSRSAMAAFQQCQAELIPFTFREIRETRLLFTLAGVELDPQGRSQLDRIVRYIQADPEVRRITVAGHTDSRGRRSFNLKLSKQRAEAVQAYLVERGVDAGRITVEAHGDRKPVGNNRTEQGRAQNRRVEITLHQ